MDQPKAREAEKGTNKELIPSPCKLVQFLVPEKGTRSVHVPPKGN